MDTDHDGTVTMEEMGDLHALASVAALRLTIFPLRRRSGVSISGRCAFVAGLALDQHLRQLGDIHRDPSRLIALGAAPMPMYAGRAHKQAAV
jgi:hypothetical protein